MKSQAFLRLTFRTCGSLCKQLIKWLRRSTRDLHYSTLVRKDHLLGLLLLSGICAFALGHLSAGQGPSAAAAIPAVFASPVSESGDISFDLQASRDLPEDRQYLRALGSLCARLVRVEALGSELLSLADMQDGEFSFSATDCRQLVEQNDSLSLLNSELGHIENKLSALTDIFSVRRVARMAWPSGVPLYGATQHSVTSRFGVRRNRVAGKTGSVHKGLDLGAAYGSPVLAMGSGVVTFSGSNGAYGNLVEIDHGNGFVTRYGHNSENLVNVGTTVKRGQMIARVGSSGRSTGPHVHVELHSHGKPINPLLTLQLPNVPQG